MHTAMPKHLPKAQSSSSAILDRESASTRTPTSSPTWHGLQAIQEPIVAEETFRTMSCRFWGGQSCLGAVLDNSRLTCREGTYGAVTRRSTSWTRELTSSGMVSAVYACGRSQAEVHCAVVRKRLAGCPLNGRTQTHWRPHTSC